MKNLIAAHDWGATPLGPIEHWPERLKAAVSICLSSPMQMAIWWGPDLIMIYNDAIIPLLGSKHPQSLGAKAVEIWPETWLINEPLVRQVMNTGKSVRHDDLLYRIDRGKGLEDSYFTISYSPLHDEGGAIEGILITSIETTANVLADRRLKEEVERQRRCLDRASSFVAVLAGPEHVVEFVNQAYIRLFGDRNFIGKKLSQAFPDPKNQQFFKLLDDVYSTGKRFATRETPIFLKSPGESIRHRHFIDFIFEPMIDEAGQVTGIFIEGHDVTARIEAQDALSESEHARRLALEGGRMGAWWWNTREENLSGDPVFMSLFGLPPTDAPIPSSIFLNQLAPASRAHLAEVRAAGLPACRSDGELEVPHPNGGTRWIKWQGGATQSDPQIITGISFDITEQKLASERQRLLLAELQHRVRNILAMIRSVIVRTAATSDNVEEYARHLEGRIAAMARTQSLLTRSPGVGIDLQNLILDELQAQIAQEEQIGCDGPDVLLSPKGAEVLTLAIHELATNSVKYGALAVPDGRVDVFWEVKNEGEPAWLRLNWRESGVELARDVVRQGFGAELITRRIPYELGGRGMMTLGRAGISAAIEFPLIPGESILQTDAPDLHYKAQA